MTAMSKKATPLPPAGSAATVYRAVQGDARLAVLHYLLSNGTSTRADVTGGTGLPNSTALVAIRELVDAGYLVTNVEGDRKGHLVQYSVDRRKLTTDLFDFMGWLLA